MPVRCGLTGQKHNFVSDLCVAIWSRIVNGSVAQVLGGGGGWGGEGMWRYGLTAIKCMLIDCDFFFLKLTF